MPKDEDASRQRLLDLVEDFLGPEFWVDDPKTDKIARALRARGCTVAHASLRKYLTRGIPADSHHKTTANLKALAAFFGVSEEWLRKGKGLRHGRAAKDAATGAAVGYRLSRIPRQNYFISGYFEGSPFRIPDGFFALLQQPVIFSLHWVSGRHSAFLTIEAASSADVMAFVQGLEQLQFRIGFSSFSLGLTYGRDRRDLPLKRHGRILSTTAKLEVPPASEKSVLDLARLAYPLSAHSTEALRNARAARLSEHAGDDLDKLTGFLDVVSLPSPRDCEAYTFLSLPTVSLGSHEQILPLLNDARVRDCFQIQLHPHHYLLHVYCPSLKDLNEFLDSISQTFSTSTKLVLSSVVKDGQTVSPSRVDIPTGTSGSGSARRERQTSERFGAAPIIALRTKPPFARTIAKALEAFLAERPLSSPSARIALYTITGKYDHVIRPTEPVKLDEFVQWIQDFSFANHAKVSEDFLLYETREQSGAGPAPNPERLGCFMIFVGQISVNVEAAIRRADVEVLRLLDKMDRPMWIDPCRRMRRHIYREMDGPTQLGEYIEEVARTREVRFATVGVVLTSGVYPSDA